MKTLVKEIAVVGNLTEKQVKRAMVFGVLGAFGFIGGIRLVSSIITWMVA